MISSRKNEAENEQPASNGLPIINRPDTPSLNAKRKKFSRVYLFSNDEIIKQTPKPQKKLNQYGPITPQAIYSPAVDRTLIEPAEVSEKEDTSCCFGRR